MAKVFRLHTNGSNTYSGWNNSTQFPYDGTSRRTITDPDGATASKEITSIPSPFARIDLVKNAFKEVVNTGNLDGNTIYHKMVSDSLDVGEIFFNIDQYSDIVQILIWNKEDNIQRLTNSQVSGHKIFADAFNKYWESDSHAYNFVDTQNFYILEYLGPQRTQNCIIGATSPATLFFSTANDLSFMSNNLQQGQIVFFDNNYEALYRRNFEYVKMLWILKCSIDAFANKLPEIEEYLNLTYRQLTDKQKLELDNITNNSGGVINEFETITIGNNEVNILGTPIYKRGNSLITNSEFAIQSSKQINYNPIPLVLPISSGNRYSTLRYTTDVWGTDNHAPFIDTQTDITMRRLPNDNRQQPYLTISDFLQPYVIKVPHQINAELYFNGNYDNQYSFLLPLTSRFFEFFTVTDLQSTINGRPMIELQSIGGGLRVTLRIPITGNTTIRYIEYTRNYIDSTINGNRPLLDLSDNTGCIVESEFDAFIMPAINFIEPQDAFYRIYLANGVEENINLSFYDGIREVNAYRCVRGDNNAIEMKAYTIEGDKFDCIKITLNNAPAVEGFVIPKLKQQQNLNTFKFAIDFGTSSTCIAYKKLNNREEVLEYDTNNTPLSPLFCNDDGREEFDVIERNILPFNLNRGSECSLPTRSVISYTINDLTNFGQQMPAFAKTNIDFFYNKRRNYDYNRDVTNLKWGEDENTETLVECYIECILLLIRNKILLEQGDIHSTEIVWFYPLSMSQNRLNRLRDVWNRGISKYFGAIIINEITESIAPIPYITNRYKGAQNIVNIDIGGGTTDIAYSRMTDVQWIASIRFASDDLFRENDGINGIIEYFKPKLTKVLNDNNLEDLISVLNNIADNENKTIEEASFLFSLKNQRQVREKGLAPISIDFDNLLQRDENFKIVFILFYSAIIYYIAQIVKTMGLAPPDYINFSGNGSKNIRIITTNNRTLAQYSRKIFELVVDIKDINLNISELQQNISPKEITCLGGLRADGNLSQGDIVVLKSNDSLVNNSEDTFAIFDDEAYKDILVGNVISFFELILKKLPPNYLNTEFGISSDSLRIAQETCCNGQQIRQYFNRAIDDLVRNSPNTAKNQIPIKEPLFFYPIKGLLIELSNAIFRSLNNN